MVAARRRRQCWAGLLALVASALLPACSFAGVSPGPAGASAPGPASTPAPTVAPSLPAKGRPLTRVTDVRPPGFTNPPAGAGLERYRNQRLAWAPCAKNLLCASALAPLNYDDPDGTAITLALAKRAAAGGPKLGTLFINPGGPGASGRSYVTYFKGRGLEGYDVVGWDPRGVGSSTPVRCFGTPEYDRFLSIDVSPDNAEERRALTAETYAFGQACLAHSGALLEHVSTETTVRDLELLRSLVGDPQLHYFGASYGTKIGALYAELYPKRVGRMVLDGAVNIGGQSLNQIQGFERALEHFASWAAQPAQKQPLGTSRTAVLDEVQALLQGLDAKPLQVAGGRLLSQQQAVGGTLNSLYGRGDWPPLLQALAAARRGDGQPLLKLADEGNFRRPDGSYGQINDAFPAVRCQDSRASSVRTAERSAAQQAKRAPVLGPLFGPDLVCPLWPVAPAPKEPRIRAAGAAPIVVVGTTGDPATPYENAEGMARQLESGVLVTLEGEGHTGYGQSACVRASVDAYLVDGVVPSDGTRCAS
jgi:pimeloyl-ACP methyl ester carboxylesterase